MKDTELLVLNNQANEQIDSALAGLRDRVGGGVDVMSLMMNPKGAVAQFGDVVGQLVAGVEALRAVNNELVSRATAVGSAGE